MLKAIAEADIENLKYFKVTSGKIAGVPVDISRTGYTGDLGYEIWIPWNEALRVWDELMDKGRAFDIHPAGMLALDVSRVEAGLLLIDVDFHGSKKAFIDLQRYTPFEMNLGRLVALDKGRFVGQEALRKEAKTGPARRIVGLEIDWNTIESIYERLALAPQIPAAASRVSVPVYREGEWVGKATTTTWSPTLKKMIALATVARGSNEIGTRLEMEYTVEAVRSKVAATVVETPFFNPARKTATPIR
jgi:aminomethyltransferase